MKRPIPGYPGYSVTADGKIYNKHGRRLAIHKNEVTGYRQVALTRDGKRTTTGQHRLVALAWLTNPDPAEKPEVHHVDHNPDNNHAANLRWVSSRENSELSWSETQRARVYRPTVAYQLHPRDGQGVGHLLFKNKGLEAAGFNPSNVMNTIANPKTPAGKPRHVKGYYPTRIHLR